MIHVAPCSCELHVRIRDLETSLRAAEDNEEERAAQVYALDDKVRELEAELAARGRSEEEYDAQARLLTRQRLRAEKAEAAAVANALRCVDLQARVAELTRIVHAFDHERVGDETPSQGVHEREEC